MAYAYGMAMPGYTTEMARHVVDEADHPNGFLDDSDQPAARLALGSQGYFLQPGPRREAPPADVRHWALRASPPEDLLEYVTSLQQLAPWGQQCACPLKTDITAEVASNVDTVTRVLDKGNLHGFVLEDAVVVPLPAAAPLPAVSLPAATSLTMQAPLMSEAPSAGGDVHAWWVATTATIFGKSVAWVRDWMHQKPSKEDARAILRLFEQIVHTNGATISGPKKSALEKIPFLEVMLRMLVETHKIRITGGAALAHGGSFLQPGRDWDVKDMPVWVRALQMLMVHPEWHDRNHRKTAQELHVLLAEIKDKPICELLWGLGFSVPPNVAPHTKRKRDAVDNMAPVEKGDRALLRQTRWQWNAKPFRTKDTDGNVEFDQNGHVLLQDGAPLKKIWGDVRVVTQEQKAHKKAKTAQ
ncbi:hypothetical protein T484DRAFT_1932550 [Baffinella frigidus]|nr:hypothetical protein T484DRAFT_1932550 [Cryptophyta sp. CCMP2293]|mmetsp:Transcript_176/g.405  ORF Transcript_176/g.405 Transcript_176/m.405 type:complete len:413 (+) Transcript_176:214-1452(+)|eukprot:CAMPEP_0180182638 /NCGR_PEP_ID=MMETSP0986-20121125/40773_1 /TAXON_ID=697907 /ORGANISM="non described non described, Strain CCMP2293" /LENGTH=412 /DNA_ID=CAMNT_0022136021 /DNA_START=180 /DNA_END=1418 /DNA_ORIENTATION=-